MSSDRHERLYELFTAAKAVPAAQRERWLEAKCGADRELLTQLRRMLAMDDESSSPLDKGAAPLMEADGIGEVQPTPQNSLLDELRSIQALGRLPDADVSSEEFCDQLSQLQLLSRDEIDRQLESGSDPKTLASQLIRQQKLSRFQAAVLLQGKHQRLQIANYLIVDLLNTGGMGTVFKAIHRPMNREVALKILSAGKFQSTDAVKRFRREIQVAATLNHRNIVTAFDADQIDGLHFLAMEYAPGMDLYQRVAQRGPMKVMQALQCVLQAAEGLHYAHKRQIVHRDIKPGNLIIADNSTIKILDMGLASLNLTTDNERGRAPGISTGEGQLTQVGGLLGTVAYMAPEQADDPKSADARSDIYSLGCTLYFLLTGSTPYGGDPRTSIERHRTEPIPSLRSQRSDVPTTLDAVYRKMLAKRPQDRQQSAKDVIAELEAIQASPSQSTAATMPPPLTIANSTSRQPVTKSRRRMMIVTLSAIAVVVLAFLAFQSLPKRDERVATSPEDPAAQATNAATGDRSGRATSATEPSPPADAEASKPAAESTDTPQPVEAGGGARPELAVLRPAKPTIIVSRQQPLQRLQISPDGKYVVTAARPATGDPRGTALAVWDATTGEELAMCNDVDACYSMEFVGEQALVVAMQGKPKNIAPQTFLIRMLGFPGLNRIFEFQCDDHHPSSVMGRVVGGNAQLFSAGWDGATRRWSADGSFQEFKHLNDPVQYASSIERAAMSSDRSRMVTVDLSGRVTILNARLEKVSADLKRQHNVTSVAFVPGRNNQLLFGTRFGYVYKFDLERNAKVQSYAGHGTPVASLAVTPQSRLLITGAPNEGFCVSDLESGHELERVSYDLTRPADPVTGARLPQGQGEQFTGQLSVSADRRWLAAAVGLLRAGQRVVRWPIGGLTKPPERRDATQLIPANASGEDTVDRPNPSRVLVGFLIEMGEVVTERTDETVHMQPALSSLQPIYQDRQKSAQGGGGNFSRSPGKGRVIGDWPGYAVAALTVKSGRDSICHLAVLLKRHDGTKFVDDVEYRPRHVQWNEAGSQGELYSYVTSEKDLYSGCAVRQANGRVTGIRLLVAPR